ncbi:helix-turn-helix DNA binding domain protein [Microbacterium phage Smarties]|uniref:Helix-turn-helix DNA-binding domain protein n=1 Tax=Microbacterium phage Ariadne TaxID=2656546 RepID=A0A649VB81_9CAUD|nr:helix-turn-helix DNA-binding domain protein [Microbacterium phage Ariadne]QGJ89464.1 helix-turn-helix DNA-binding domain protein [Microbacterium phage Ariadne]QGJ91451.1 helix-turn-helix DNA binding domain protein [Microbacterium phage Smarties]
MARRPLLPDLPTWIMDAIEARADATGMSFEEALLASIDVKVVDPLAETLGWAVARGVPAKVVARRSHYSLSTVEAAATRYKRRMR